MPSRSNDAIIAGAGSAKTQYLIDRALANENERIVITTYTTENLDHIRARIHERVGCIPANITLMGWLGFLMNQCVRPYQHSVIGAVGVIRSLDFKGRRSRHTPRATPRPFYLDKHSNVYRDGLADFTCVANKATDGLVIHRLEGLYDWIYIDEAQDLVGYDLDFLDLLFASSIGAVVVGDPRQHTYATNLTTYKKKYRGTGLVDWFRERTAVCELEERTENYRCNQAICDFADALYPNLAPSESKNAVETGHDGIFVITKGEIDGYIATYDPVLLRDSRATETFGYEARNIGLVKGRTFDRVLIFPTGPMKKYVQAGKAMSAPTRTYIAATRARHSVAFVC
jgi:DNA helicase-2/ATP-dependent DNA helicase PcrA